MKHVTREADLTATLDPRTLQLPAEPKVLDIRVEPYVDDLGDAELRVWVVLDDSTTAEQQSIESEWAITRVIRKALHEAGNRRYTYMRFLTRSQFLQDPGTQRVR